MIEAIMVAKMLSYCCLGEIRTGWTFALIVSCIPVISDGHIASRVAMYDVDSEDCVLNLGQGQSLTIVCSTGFQGIVLNVIELFARRYIRQPEKKLQRRTHAKSTSENTSQKPCTSFLKSLNDSKHRWNHRREKRGRSA